MLALAIHDPDVRDVRDRDGLTDSADAVLDGFSALGETPMSALRLVEVAHSPRMNHSSRSSSEPCQTVSFSGSTT